MFKRIASPLVTLALVAAAVNGQQRPQTQNKQGSAQQDEVVKVTTNLVQIDVVVTDKSGRQVTDLAAEDFEVSEDGKRVPITNFSYVNAGGAAAEAGAARREEAAPQGQRGAPVAPATLRREHVRRTVALVVDDLGLSFESMGFVRDALRKFVEEQMQPTDVVAVFRTSAGVGALQQFTSDKRLLHAAIERVRWYPQGRGNVSRNTAFNEASMGADARDPVQFTQEAEESRAGLYSVGTFGAASAVVRGLADMPGRKSVVLISEAFRLFHAQGRNVQLIDAMRRLTTQANAASVTIYTMDASGLQTDSFTAEDQPGAPAYMITPELFAAAAVAGNPGISGVYVKPNAPPRTLDRVDANSIAAQAERDSGAAFRRLNALMEQRRVEREEAHTVLSYLAAKTGGIFMRNRNDLGAAMQRIMDDQRGYYLIGYRPDLSEDDRDARPARMRNISVKVKRPGVQMRTRAGYFGVPDADRRARPRTREEQLTAALLSPFASGDVRVRLTSLFGTEPAPGPPRPYVRALLHVDARDLSFKEGPGGARSTELEIVGVVVGDNGQIVEQDSSVQALRAADQEEYERLQQEGLVYILNFPVKRVGSYQLRVAARESSSERLGAASHFVEVPNLSAARLALSGIVLSGVDSAAQTDPQAGPAVRRLRQGQLLDYRYYIHNARVGTDGRPQLQTQMRIFRDNQPVFTGKLLPFDASKQTDPKRLGAAGRVRIGPELTPGQYLLQVTVNDALTPGRAGTATQWIDFEIVN